MSIAFEQGFNYVLDNMGIAFGGQTAQNWLSLEELIQDISDTVQTNKTDPSRLQGNVAEVWHGDTLNYSARVHHTAEMAQVLKLNTYGSVDIQVGDKSYSSKYYKTGTETAKAQAKSHYQYYMEHKAKAERHGKPYETLEEFLKKREIEKEDMHKSMYDGQAKLIPKGQLDAAKDHLFKKIQHERAVGNIELANRYQETYYSLVTTLEDTNGNSSVGLSRDDAQKLVQSVREGKLDKKVLQECGIDLDELVSAQDIMHEAFKAGLSAAVISLVIGLAPTVVNGLLILIKEGEIDPDLFAEMGYKGLNASAKGFLNGTLSAALVASCQAGKLGSALMDANASLISTAVVLMIGTLENGIKYATGKITKAQMADEIARLHITTAFSVGTGLLASVWFSEIPPLAIAAYMLGSFIGGVIGGFVYNAGRSLFMSFCVESGCTFFGIVDQNYELPQEIIDEIGIEVFDYEKFDYETFQADTFQLDTFTPDTIEYDRFGIRILRRGVLEFGRVGYI